VGDPFKPDPRVFGQIVRGVPSTQATDIVIRVFANDEQDANQLVLVSAGALVPGNELAVIHLVARMLSTLSRRAPSELLAEAAATVEAAR
jgi:hypothetical protein